MPLATLFYIALATEKRLLRSGSDDLDADPPFVGRGSIADLVRAQVMAWHFSLERDEDLPPSTAEHGSHG